MLLGKGEGCGAGVWGVVTKELKQEMREGSLQQEIKEAQHKEVLA